MYRSILVPLDGSPAGEQALPAAVALSRRTGARLHLAHVRTMEWIIDPPASGGDERAYLDAVCAGVCDALGESVSVTLLSAADPQRLGPNPSTSQVAERLTAFAAENGIDLVVMATHGRSGFSRMYFGSVAEALLRTAEVPVLLIRTAADADTPGNAAERFRRILVPVAGGPMAEAVLDASLELGEGSDAAFTLFRVVPVPMPAYEPQVPVASLPAPQDLEAVERTAREEVERLAGRVRDAGHEAEVVIVAGHSPAAAILDHAADTPYDAIVVGTHARKGLERMLLGSVANKVLRSAACPTLVVPPRVIDRAATSAGPAQSAGDAG